MSRLGRLGSKTEGSNRANSNSNQNFTHGGPLPKEGLRAVSNRQQFYTLLLPVVACLPVNEGLP
jgi:hypothetical protein